MGQATPGALTDHSGELPEGIKLEGDSSEFKLLSSYSACRVRVELEWDLWVITACVAAGARHSKT